MKKRWEKERISFPWRDSSFVLSSAHTDSRPRVIGLRKEKSGFEKSPPLATNSVARARTLTNSRPPRAGRMA